VEEAEAPAAAPATGALGVARDAGGDWIGGCGGAVTDAFANVHITIPNPKKATAAMRPHMNNRPSHAELPSSCRSVSLLVFDAGGACDRPCVKQLSQFTKPKKIVTTKET
jgi:hypothetical protein